MAYDVIRQFLGQALQQKLLQQTPAYKQQLVEGELKNRMFAMEMDELFPLKVQMLEKELEYMIDPMAKIEATQAAEFKSHSALIELQKQADMAVLSQRLAGEAVIKGIPSHSYSHGDPDTYGRKGREELRKDMKMLAGQLKSMEFTQKVWDDTTATEITKRGVLPEKKTEYERKLTMYNNIADLLYSNYGVLEDTYEPAPVIAEPTQGDVLDETPVQAPVSDEQQREQARSTAFSKFKSLESEIQKNAEREARESGDVEFFRQKRLRNRLAF